MSIPLILLLATLVAIFASLWKLFQKAGRPAWEGFIPFYNFIIWQKITNRPWYWALVLIIPGVQFLMLIIMNVQLAWSFGQRGTKNTLLAIFAPFYLLPKMAFDDEIQYTENLIWKSKDKRNAGREWTDAILFAIIVAFIVRTFVFEAFVIPTPSMERSMLVGDYLFVSKARYGAKLPETPIAFPLTHHTLPILNIPSFLEWQKLDYSRLPGWADIEVGDPVVFNFPEGDTVIVGDEAYTYYQMIRNEATRRAGSIEKYLQNRSKYEAQVRKAALDGRLDYLKYDPVRGRQYSTRAEIITRPKDKKENYVKRAVAGPGDVLEIRDGQVYLNETIQDQFKHIQYNYLVYTNTSIGKKLREELKEDLDLNYSNINSGMQNPYLITMTQYQVDAMEELSFVDSIVPRLDPRSKEVRGNVLSVFPHDSDFDWSRDNFGPLQMPAKGLTIPLSKQNMSIYRRAIEVYEQNEVSMKDGQVYLNGELAEEYTFKLDYYWLMGDNRHNSLDSRYWGFVPEDHVVGRPSFVWLSLDQELGWFDGKLRFERMFRSVN